MLDKIKPNQADALQHRALMRLTLRTIGETHRIFYGFQAWLVDLVRQSADEEGNAQAANLLSQMSAIDSRFRRAVQDWVRLFGNAREQAASLPFGVLVIRHNAYMTEARLQETLTGEDLSTVIRLWQQRRDRALAATRDRIFGDGLNLSQRIWRLEQGGLSTIRRTLATSLAERTSAAELAGRLERVLGADMDMPRWAEDRLYSMTPRQRAQSRDGLITDTSGRSEGISYNALRLARTELQFANHAVTSEIAQRSPWVTGRKVVLSPAHPRSDVCDEWASGGPYAKDLEVLPLHANCLCRYEEVLMPVADFKEQAKGWLNGDNNFLDDYQQWLGTQQVTEPLPPQMPLADLLEAWLSLGSSDHARLLGLR